MDCSDDTRSKRSQSFFNINALPDTIWLEILIRLPAKCANRYKSVSKLWNSLISHPDFVRRFIHHRQSRPLHHRSSEYLSHLPFTFFFCYANRTGIKLCITSDAQVFKSRGFSLRFLPYLNPEENHFPVLIASYNDLLLCRVKSGSPCCIVYCICNPLTMQSVVLPPAPRQDERKVFKVGFVIDAVSGQVTILRVPVSFKGDGVSTQLLKLDIFSSQANVWREFIVSCPPSFSSNPWVSYCVVCNQILYWLCNLCILSYDAFGTTTHGNGNDDDDDDDRCRFIGFPSDFKAYVPNRCLGVCQGRLRLSQLLLWRDGYDGGPTLIVWQLMEEEDYKWCLMHKVVLSEMASKTPEIIRIVNMKMILGLVLGFHPQDSDIVYLRLQFNCVVLCNIRSRTLELACNISPPAFDLSYVNCYFRLVLPWWPTPIPPILP